MAEFFIDHFGPLDGRICVVGRNGDDPIRVGDEFTMVRRYVQPKRFEDYIQPMPLESERPTKARVTHLHAYDQEFQEIDRGMTCLMSLDTTNSYFYGDVLCLTTTSR